MTGFNITDKRTDKLLAFVPEDMIKAVGNFDKYGNRNTSATTYFFKDHIMGLGRNISSSDYDVTYINFKTTEEWSGLMFGVF
jgi:hypothetical protein